MAVTRGKVWSTLVGLGILGIALLTLREVDGAVATTSPGLLEQVLREIQDGQAEEDAEGIAADVGLVPLAMPCMMRHPRLVPGVDRSWRHRFAAATLATDPEQAALLLAGLLETAPDALARWRVEIALVELALRGNNAVQAATHMARAQAIAVPASCRADMAFLAATLSETSTGAAAHLDEAVRLDPGFWLAQEALARIALAGTGDDPAACEADIVRILRSVVQLGALARQDVQFQQLDRALEALPDTGRSALLRGMILRQTAQPDAARASYRDGLEGLGGSRCDRLLARGLDGMLAATEATEATE